MGVATADPWRPSRGGEPGSDRIYGGRMDAETRARQLVDGGATVEEVISGLRAAGVTRMESASALMKATGMNHVDVFRAVLGSPVWADAIGTLDDWIDPPEVPDAATLARLREVCAAEPRITEAWIRGSRFFGGDGALLDSAGVVFVLDPALTEDDVEGFLEEGSFLMALIHRLAECWPLPPGGQRGYKPMTKDIVAAHAEHSLEVFRREAPS